MKKFLGSKNALLILGGITILVIFYLIASLGSLQLKPAQPFYVVQESTDLPPGEPPAWNGIGFVIVVFIILIAVLFILLPPEQRKKFLWMLGGFILLGGIVLLIISQLGVGKVIPPTQEAPAFVAASQASEPTGTPEPLVTPAVFTPPQVSSWTSYIVALVILLAVVAGWAWFVWRRRKADAPLDAFAKIARSALDDLEAGRDWGDTILNSYYRMNQVVADWRGIHRQVNMTPAEFAGYLVSTHLPPEAVTRLTGLFERVRYGDKKSTPRDVHEAVDCLTAILEYCQAVQ